MKPGRSNKTRTPPTPAPTRAAGRKAWRGWGLAALLLLATLAAYAPAWHGGMLWDDSRHLTSVELQRPDGLRRIWFELGATQQYYPVVHSAFWLQHRLWGDDTTGYHLVNIGLHALSAFLVALLLRRLAVPGAGLAAVVFALHPVHVESVAWMTELKNVLSGSFYLAAALLYAEFDATRRRATYAGALALFALALLSKSVTATLPVAWLIVCWWRRGRISWRGDAVPLVPFVILGAAAGTMTAWVERTVIGAQGPEFQLSVVERVLIAGRAFWFYLATLAWPSRLVFIYPRWEVSAATWWQYLYPIGLLALLAALWRVRRRSRAMLAVALLYLATLAPALGFLNVYPFRYSFVADHFQYLASIPVIALFAAGVSILARRWRVGPLPPAFAAIGLAVLLGSLTFAQSRQYADAETLYNRTLRLNPACWLAHVNLGVLELEERPEAAAARFRQALRIKPDLPEGHYNLGLVAHRAGRLQEAMGHYREALRVAPARAEVHNNLGDVLRRLGRPEEAIGEGEQALRLEPHLPEASYNLGLALQAVGRQEEARARFLEALATGFDPVQARYQLANTLQMAGLREQAVVEYREVIRLQPGHAGAHNNLGSALQGLGRDEEAMACFREAVRLAPGYADAHYYLGNGLLNAGRAAEAVEQYRAALRSNPSDAAAHNNLGLAFESLGRFGEAAAEYQAALRLRPDLAQARESLARVAARGRSR